MPILSEDGWTVTVQDCMKAVEQAAAITPTGKVVGGVVLCDGLHKIANVVEGDMYAPSEDEVSALMNERADITEPDPFIGWWYTTTRSQPGEYERALCREIVVRDDEGAALIVICPTRVFLIDIESGEIVLESPKA